VGSELKLVNHFKQEDQDVQPYTTLTDQMKAKNAEITELGKKITAVKQRKKRATKQQMLDVRTEEENLKGLKQQLAQLVAMRFEFLVKTRNGLITEQLQETMQSHMPKGMVLEVHCVSNQHYAALKGVSISGPRLSANSTGVPQLRARTLALMAPRLLDTLEHYTNFSLHSALQDLQLWLSSVSINRRQELLDLTSQPENNFGTAAESRLDAFAKEIQSSAENVLTPAIPDATKAALKQLEKKKTKHWKTILAFVRKFGNHKTKICPKESWNENFSKAFAEVVTKSENSLTQARGLLTSKLECGVINDLTAFLKQIEGM
jgi:hypothetical protein